MLVDQQHSHLGIVGHRGRDLDDDTSAAAAPAGTLVGPGCASYAEKVPTGPGSVAGMAKDPVTVAASNNPLLTTLTSALTGKLNPNVNLVQTLDSGQSPCSRPPTTPSPSWTPATVEKLKTDSNLLTSILDLPRGACAGQPRPGRRSAQDCAGRDRHGHRIG